VNTFDLVYLHRISNASKYLTLARHYFPRARLIYSVADLHHVRFARQTSDAQPAAPGQAIPNVETAARRETHAPKSKPISDEEWVIAVKFFRELGVWPDNLGPSPGQSGCRAPLDVL
jgi:hypothetical protein